ncbi:hypothetical protein [Flammeovirga sp. EKP202]|uniref:hypothetical protein n=1 Tax=Flammeovirga sp. EKP202 TaxID=2770592 RepID=UPI00165F14B4|nr:hypothetical protein [Flammeovirga sp. EKP202]MBD0400548.1 hypothetical protein [Flammeovirga sp. EKP202]
MESKIQKSFQNGPFADAVTYKSVKGEISLVYPCYVQHGKYEIYDLKGNLFGKTETYSSVEQAEKRIEDLLS